MKVTTFFAHVPECRDDDLIGMWEKSWQKGGWETKVFSTQDANDADHNMCGRFATSPLLEGPNPTLYKLACMMTWIPLTTVTEPTLHVDWDIMCNGLKPEQLIVHDPVPTFLASSLCPCAVVASPKGYRLMAHWLDFAPFAPNYSREALLKDNADQYAFSLMPASMAFIQSPSLCKLYNEDNGWETAPMIHFPNRLTPYPRSATVRKVLGL
jgi:hypothetical protein